MSKRRDLMQTRVGPSLSSWSALRRSETMDPFASEFAPALIKPTPMGAVNEDLVDDNLLHEDEVDNTIDMVDTSGLFDDLAVDKDALDRAADDAEGLFDDLPAGDEVWDDEIDGTAGLFDDPFVDEEQEDNCMDGLSSEAPLFSDDAELTFEPQDAFEQEGLAGDERTPCGCSDCRQGKPCGCGGEAMDEPEWYSGEPSTPASWLLPLQPILCPSERPPGLPLGRPAVSPPVEPRDEGTPPEGSYPPQEGFPPEAICFPEKASCTGFYVSYPKGSGLLTKMKALMKACGLAVRERDATNQRCGLTENKKRACCRYKKGKGTDQVGEMVKLELAAPKQVPKSMHRIALMIQSRLAPLPKKDGTAKGVAARSSSFCIQLSGATAAIDRYGDRSVDAVFNPDVINGLTNDGQVRVPFKGYYRSRCELLAHVIAESFWGKNCYSDTLAYEGVRQAHWWALMEENWVRKHNGRPLMAERSHQFAQELVRRAKILEQLKAKKPGKYKKYMEEQDKRNAKKKAKLDKELEQHNKKLDDAYNKTEKRLKQAVETAEKKAESQPTALKNARKKYAEAARKYQNQKQSAKEKYERAIRKLKDPRVLLKELRDELSPNPTLFDDLKRGKNPTEGLPDLGVIKRKMSDFDEPFVM